jgi:hypothetical protein
MKNSKNLSFIFILILLIIAFYLGALNPASNKARDQKLAQEIKAQLRDELRKEIKQELLAELQSTAADKPQQLAQTQTEVFPTQQIIAKNDSSESLNQAVRRIAREVVQESNQDMGLSDREMDQYVASGEIESNLPVGSGYSKTPDMVLAKNNSDKAMAKAKTTNADEKALETTAGEGQRPESVERTLQQRGSMLLGKGRWVIEPSTSWAHFSSNKISLQGVVILDVFNIGVLGAQEVNRDIFVETLGVKYGLMENLQTEIKIPYRAEYDRVTTINANNTPTDENTRGSTGLGDIDLSVSRQIGWEDGWKPDLIAAFGFKTRTGDSYGHDIAFGSGHYGLRGALIASKSSDPAVIFGSLSYTYNFERTDIEGLGDIKPGDSIGYSLGTAIALSYQTAINFSFDNSVVMKTRRNGVNVLDSFVNVANFRTGLNWAIDESKSVNLSVSFGLTKDSPDVTVELGVPISF